MLEIGEHQRDPLHAFEGNFSQAFGIVSVEGRCLSNDRQSQCAEFGSYPTTHQTAPGNDTPRAWIRRRLAHRSQVRTHRSRADRSKILEVADESDPAGEVSVGVGVSPRLVFVLWTERAKPGLDHIEPGFDLSRRGQLRTPRNDPLGRRAPSLGYSAKYVGGCVQPLPPLHGITCAFSTHSSKRAASSMVRGVLSLTSNLRSSAARSGSTSSIRLGIDGGFDGRQRTRLRIRSESVSVRSSANSSSRSRMIDATRLRPTPLPFAPFSVKKGPKQIAGSLAGGQCRPETPYRL